MSEEKQQPYRVLARKYRPRNFGELVGQDALVRTLSNAINSGRIAHAFMLTGIRGTGKTTTARIIAKALNYTGPDGKAGPTTGATDDCDICKAITEDRHPDVLEMDAASRTGVNDIREILDGVRYAPTSARYKVYIIDEVHMLSTAAFNALLKTLEEPPEHVIFIFATTEIRKVPVTVLSRCQRFDLRRIDAAVLADYYKTICEKEGVAAEDEALALIGRAADGSVRDGLSLLDQAIALSGETITVEQVQDMLGLADRMLVLDILEHALKGDCGTALDKAADLYKKGADPAVLLNDMLDFTHLLTRARAVPQAAEGQGALAKDAQGRITDLSTKLSMPSLGRAWQILLKGMGEVNNAPNPQAAAEMIIIRLAYAADLPDPGDLIKKIKSEPAGAPSVSAAGAVSSGGAAAPASPAASGMDAPAPEPVAMAVGGGGGPMAMAAPVFQPEAVAANEIKCLADVEAALVAHRKMILATELCQWVHLIKLSPKALEFRQKADTRREFSQDLRNALKEITGEQWIVSVTDKKQGEPTLNEQKEAAEEKRLAAAREHPVVAQVLEFFPDATLRVRSGNDN